MAKDFFKSIFIIFVKIISHIYSPELQNSLYICG